MNFETPEQLRSYLKSLPHLSDKGKDERVRKSKKDFYYATKTYFSHHINEPETSKFREYVYKNLDSITLKDRKSSYEAYRGGAKTTIITRLFTLWQQAIKRAKRNTIIVSSTLDLSKESLEFIKAELEENELLIADYEIRQGDTWSKDEIVFYSGDLKFRLKVFGAGTKIRGGNWLGLRPDLIICDDVENDENVESKAQRDKFYKWFTRAIMKLPSRESTTYNIIIVGTKLHHDSLLSRVQKRSDFKSFRFPLVLEFPSNLDELDVLTVTLEDLKDMVIDNTAIDKVELIKEYLEDKDSFMSEYQNEPLSKEGTTFSDYELFELQPQTQSITLGIDPALGKSKGDYFAATVLRYDGKRFYATVKMYKIKATLMIDKLIALYIDLLKENVPIKIAIETVQFQEFFKDTLDDKCKSIGLHLPIVPIKNTVNKELRIDSISPLVNNHTILVDKKSLIFIDELDTYPKSPHDDGLDSLEMAYRIAKKPAFDYKEAFKHLKAIESKNKALQSIFDG